MNSLQNDAHKIIQSFQSDEQVIYREETKWSTYELTKHRIYENNIFEIVTVKEAKEICKMLLDTFDQITGYHIDRLGSYDKYKNYINDWNLGIDIGNNTISFNMFLDTDGEKETYILFSYHEELADFIEEEIQKYEQIPLNERMRGDFASVSSSSSSSS